ncbi:MAG: 2-isopropylmalate synthase [Chitinivibrionales bacterium]|nr:2-isopropylmalate synthase [Chitinivibrionales bacterium]
MNHTQLQGSIMHKKNLVNVDEPNLFESMFSHEHAPRIFIDGTIYEEIDGRQVAFDPREALQRDLCISDTTFRDGQQSLPPYTIEQVVTLYKFLNRIAGPQGLIRQSEFFIYSEKDREAVRKCRELDLQYPDISAWIRADEGDFQLVKNMQLKETGVLTSCSDYHIFHKMKLDRQKALDKYLRLVEVGLEAGIRMRCHLEDVTRADIDGFVVPFVQRVMELCKDAPDELQTKIRLCDTMGYGITYPGAALPRSVPKLIYKMIHEAGVPSDRLEWHGHNDFHKVHINACTGWLYGCNIANTTLFGFGERTGNPPLEAAVFEYLALKGPQEGIDTLAITEAADYFQREMNIPIANNYPFVGANFNVTRAGIHADGLNRDERIYNIFDTGKLLGRPPRVAVTDKSGADGVALWVNSFLGLDGNKKLSKIKIHKIGRWVMDQYKDGRTTAISDREMEAQVKLHLPHYYASHCKRRSSQDSYIIDFAGESTHASQT